MDQPQRGIQVVQAPRTLPQNLKNVKAPQRILGQGLPQGAIIMRHENGAWQAPALSPHFNNVPMVAAAQIGHLIVKLRQVRIKRKDFDGHRRHGMGVGLSLGHEPHMDSGVTTPLPRQAAQLANHAVNVSFAKFWHMFGEIVGWRRARPLPRQATEGMACKSSHGSSCKRRRRR